MLAVGAGHGEAAVLEHDVGFRRLQQVGRDLLRLVDHLVHRLDDGRAADRERARAVGAHAERDLGGVAVDDLDVLDRDAEAVGDELGERRLVALAVAVRAGEHRHAAGRVDADLARLESPARAPSAPATLLTARCRRPRCSWRCRCRAACRAPWLPPCGRRSPGSRSGPAPDPGSSRTVAAVVLQRHRRLVGHGRGRDEVAPPQLGLVDAQLARRVLDDALDQVAVASGRPAPR